MGLNGPYICYLKRGPDSDRLKVILKALEPAWTTDTKKLYLGDGVTPGGNYLCDLAEPYFMLYPVPVSYNHISLWSKIKKLFGGLKWA